MKLTRRHFIESTATLTAAMALPLSMRGADKPARTQKPVRLGGPVFTGTDDPEALALEHRKLGYRAAYCPGVSLNDETRIKAIREAFAKHDVVIAEVGRWVNLTDPNADKRAQNLKTVTEGLALAEAVGALCCVDIAGSRNPDIWYGPHPANFSKEFFDEVVENARKIIDAVKPKHSKFSYEIMGWAIPDSPDSYLKLVKAVDRPAFGVHLDPCNAVNSPEKFYQNAQLIDECFDKLGRWIVSCHAKDLTWDVEMNVHFREVRPGLGQVDYATYLRRMARLSHDAPLMIEHLPNAQENSLAAQYILETGRKNGVDFE
jgi:sugar phosphate isomerase/epimerase